MRDMDRVPLNKTSCPTQLMMLFSVEIFKSVNTNQIAEAIQRDMQNKEGFSLLPQNPPITGYVSYTVKL